MYIIIELKQTNFVTLNNVIFGGKITYPTNYSLCKAIEKTPYNKFSWNACMEK